MALVALRKEIRSRYTAHLIEIARMRRKFWLFMNMIKY
ncbi:hypothetical protein AB3N59_06365 [Leptospira sp. WS92.C1]